MKNYFFNCLLTALVSFITGIVVFLVGTESESVIGSSITAGMLMGAAVPLSYVLGNLTCEDNGFNGKRLVLMLIAGLVFGALGGFLISVG